MAGSKGFQISGSIDLADFTTTAYLPANGTLVSFGSFKDSGKIILEMGSADLSGAVTCTLQVSGSKSYWGTAQEDGSDVTFTLSATSPVVEIIEGAEDMYWRIAITIDSKTGVVDYSVKDVL